MCEDADGWQVSGEVRLAYEAFMEVDERPDETYVENTINGGYWGSTVVGRTTHVKSVRPVGCECDDAVRPTNTA